MERHSAVGKSRQKNGETVTCATGDGDARRGMAGVA